MKNKIGLVELVAQYVTEKTITEAKAKEILSLPLIELPDVNTEDGKPWRAFLDTDVTNEGDTHIVTEDDFILLKAAYWMGIFGCFIVTIKNPTFDGIQKPIEISFELLTPYDKLTDTKIFIQGHAVIDEKSDCKWDFKKVTLSQSGKTKNLMELSEKNVGTITQNIIYCVRLLHFFSMFQESLDRYPVSVKTSKEHRLIVGKSKVDKRLALVRRNSPKIIFLNALPKDASFATPSVVGSDAEHKERKLHQRRGHWKTLSHERYKYHAKYLIKDGVRVKPSWIGTLSTEYAGNVYKVLLNPKTDEL